jgi:hypothetical protein
MHIRKTTLALESTYRHSGSEFEPDSHVLDMSSNKNWIPAQMRRRNDDYGNLLIDRGIIAFGRVRVV